MTRWNRIFARKLQWKEFELGNGFQQYVILFRLLKIGYSLNETDFKQKIHDAIKLRQEEIIDKQELQLFTDQRIAEAINKSAFISSILIYFN